MGVDGVPAAGEIDGLMSTVDPELAPAGAARAASQKATIAMTPKTVRPRERVEVRSVTFPDPAACEPGSTPVPRSIVGCAAQINGTGVRVAGTRWHQPTRGISLSVTPRTAKFVPCITPRRDSCGLRHATPGAGSGNQIGRGTCARRRPAPHCVGNANHDRRLAHVYALAAPSRGGWGLGRLIDLGGSSRGSETGSRGRSPAGLRLFCSPGSETAAAEAGPAARTSLPDQPTRDRRRAVPVSYTHLTLPTIYSV